MNIDVPRVNNQCVCVVDRNRPDLAAVISSHFQLAGTYFPLFECPRLSAPAADDEELVDEHEISRIRGREFNTLVNNTLVRLGGCEHVLLAGLSHAQKSYLDFTKYFHVIEINDVASATEILPGITGTTQSPVLSWPPEQFPEGLIMAKRMASRLAIVPKAPPAVVPLDRKEGLIVIEENGSSGVIVAINYADSVNADILLVRPLADDDPKIIRQAIDEWQQGDAGSYEFVENEVTKRVGNLDFNSYAYATFFTEGLPYSLILKNCIPFTYVNLNLRPDLFVINNILYDDGANFGGAVIFSPLFFADEETEKVSQQLTANGFYSRELLGKQATVRNLDYHLKEFPYDVLHICSHGGEVDGYGVEEEFTDRYGQKHLLEYDEVVGFAPEPGVDQVAVTSKQIFKKMDGMVWRSKELKEKYGHDVFVDMQQFLRQDYHERSLKRTPKANIPSSCAIKCYRSIHQGMFQTLAAHSSPFIFNNTCWSWLMIAESFLYGGARGYIGTLWAIDNQVAAETAIAFYDNIFDLSLLEAFYIAAIQGKGTPSEDIYIFWGLHFSVLKRGDSPQDSRKKIFRALLQSVYRWRDQENEAKGVKAKKRSAEYRQWIENELRMNFHYEDMKDVVQEFIKKDPEGFRELLKRRLKDPGNDKK